MSRLPQGVQPTVVLLREGTDTSQGTPQLLSNISACLAVAQTIATTLGPRGMDKLIVNERGEATISSELPVCFHLASCEPHAVHKHGDTNALICNVSSDDGATLLRLLDIVHPAARTLVDIARAQDAEVGDGTTSVTLLAAEILKEVKGYVEEGVGVHVIIKGLRAGRDLALKKLDELAITVDKSDPE